MMVYESLFQRSYDTEQCGAGKSQRNPYQWLGVPLPFGLLPVEESEETALVSQLVLLSPYRN